MSAYDHSRIEKPQYFNLGPLRRGRGKRQTAVFGFDTEADTRTGRPMLLQVAAPWHNDESDVWAIEIADEPHALLETFLALVEEHCTRKDTEYVIYGFNLMYEWTQFFGDLDEELRTADTLMLSYRQFDLDATNDKRYFMKIKNSNTKRMVRVVDAYAFYKTSLDKAAIMLGMEGKYHTTLDRSGFTRDDLRDPEFLRYSRQDAIVTRNIGRHINGMHEDYDVTQCISAPMFASKVYRHHFITKGIDLAHEELEQYGLFSYHGGKNGLYLPDPVQLNAYQYDITSAYPEAMRQLPDPEHADWIKVARHDHGAHAIYRATLQYQRCTYRGMMMFDGQWPQSGYIEDAFITSYELDAMLDAGECKVIDIDGYRMTGPEGGGLVRYVDRFFEQKQRHTGAERETDKLFLNSLYGKFFQKVPVGNVGNIYVDLEHPDGARIIESDPDSPFDWRAGGLYHPPIASLITGFVRAKIHRLEHKYGALMTSTDGFFAEQAPDPTDIGKNLGDLTASHGDLKLWRERLYIYRPDDGDKPKVALHGFRGNVDALDQLPLAHGKYTYRAQQMVTLALSTKRLQGEQYRPGRFAQLKFDITI